MDGLSFLRSLPAERVVCGYRGKLACAVRLLGGNAALEAGAVDVVAKPGGPFRWAISDCIARKDTGSVPRRRSTGVRHTCASMYPSTSLNAYRPKRARHCRSLPSARRTGGTEAIPCGPIADARGDSADSDRATYPTRLLEGFRQSA